MTTDLKEADKICRFCFDWFNIVVFAESVVSFRDMDISKIVAGFIQESIVNHICPKCLHNKFPSSYFPLKDSIKNYIKRLDEE